MNLNDQHLKQKQNEPIVSISNSPLLRFLYKSTQPHHLVQLVKTQLLSSTTSSK